MKRVSVILIAMLFLALPASLGAQTLFATGFEASEGYAVGQLHGTNGWTESATPYEAVITDAVAVGGTQSLLMNAYHGRGLTHALSASATQLQVEVDMAKAYLNTAQWWVALQGAGGSSERSAAFGFNNGQLSYYKGGTGWTTIRTFNANQAYHFKAVVDIPSKTWDLWIDGQLEASSIPIYHNTAVSATQVYLYRGYLSISGQPTDYNYAVADNISVTAVPEPSSLAALTCGLAGLVGFARKRR